MKKALLLLLPLLLVSCEKVTSTDTVESLTTNPEQLKGLHAQYKADRASVGDTVCDAVA